jgi:hypothetical protein
MFNTKIKTGMGGLGLVLALFAASPSHANTVNDGLRIVSTQSETRADVTQVETRISRGLQQRWLGVQQLRIALVAADGTVRAEQQRLVGPAQLVRGNTRDIYLTTNLNAVATADERLVVEWVKLPL